MPKYCQQPKRTTQTIFDPGPVPRQGFVDEGRVKVTEMIKVFLSCFDIFIRGFLWQQENLANMYIYI